jgi:hypothetical protein
MSSLVFEHQSVQDLYKKATSKEFANLVVPNAIRNYILPSINAVTENKSACQEALHKWGPFYTVMNHLQSQQPVIQGLDLNTSMCTSLWFFIYH